MIYLKALKIKMKYFHVQVAVVPKTEMITYLDSPHIATSHIKMYDPSLVTMAITTFKVPVTFISNLNVTNFF